GGGGRVRGRAGGWGGGDGGAGLQADGRPRAGAALPPQRAAVLHGLEEHRGRGGRLRDGAGAGDELPELQDVRTAARTGAGAAAGRALGVYLEPGGAR